MWPSGSTRWRCGTCTSSAPCTRPTKTTSTIRKEPHMLRTELNERITRVGPGTPAGNLLRRYWQPVCVADELTEEKPVKKVTVLHEELVIFREKNGEYGCLTLHCAHRGCSLFYGFIEEGGLRCAYHGWKFAPDGQCLEQPFEPPDSHYKDRVRQ